MASSNISKGSYDFKDGKGSKVGKVNVNEDGDWSYIGDKKGANSGRIKDEGDGHATFNDHKGNPVAKWTKGGGVTWSDADGDHTGTLKKRP